MLSIGRKQIIALKGAGRREVFVEFFCGTKSFGKGARAYGDGDMVVYTADVDLDCIPKNPDARRNHFVADMLGDVAEGLPAGLTSDQLGGVCLADLMATLDVHKEAGDIIYIHGSPPCDAVSRMNTKGPKNPAKYAAKLAKSLRISHAFVAFAERYADAWTLENPATGKLWKPEVLRGLLTEANKRLADVPRLDHRCDIDYCQYGFCMQKETGFAFSSRAMCDDFARDNERCPGPASCRMCVVGDNGVRKHVVCMDNVKGYYDCTTKHARYPIPPALVACIITAMREEAGRVRTAARTPAAEGDGGRPRPRPPPHAAEAMPVQKHIFESPMAPVETSSSDDDSDGDFVVVGPVARPRPNRAFVRVKPRIVRDRHPVVRARHPVVRRAVHADVPRAFPDVRPQKRTFHSTFNAPVW